VGASATVINRVIVKAFDLNRPSVYFFDADAAGTWTQAAYGSVIGYFAVFRDRGPGPILGPDGRIICQLDTHRGKRDAGCRTKSQSQEASSVNFHKSSFINFEILVLEVSYLWH